MKLGSSPPSVSRDGGECLGPAGVTQSLEGGLNRNNNPQLPAGILPNALNRPQVTYTCQYSWTHRQNLISHCLGSEEMAAAYMFVTNTIVFLSISVEVGLVIQWSPVDVGSG